MRRALVALAIALLVVLAGFAALIINPPVGFLQNRIGSDLAAQLPTLAIYLLAALIIGALASAELSLALGRSNVVHAALKSGRIAERLVFDAGRLNGFRPLKPWVWAGFSEGEASTTG